MKTRSALVLAHDAIAAAVAWYLAYWLRFNFDIPDSYTHSWVVSLAFVVPLQTAVFWHFGLYRGMWRFASLSDLKRIVLAVGFHSWLCRWSCSCLGGWRTFRDRYCSSIPCCWCCS